MQILVAAQAQTMLDVEWFWRELLPWIGAYFAASVACFLAYFTSVSGERLRPINFDFRRLAFLL